MRIKRNNRGATLFLTDNEFKLLQRIARGFDADAAWKDMTSGERRSWSQRIRNGEFMRVDQDKRSGYHA